MPAVLFLGARSPACLELTRLFGQNKWEVVTADSLRFPLTWASRSCAEHLWLPSARESAKAWAEALIDVVSHHHISLIIPTSEETFLLSTYRDWVAKVCPVLVAPANHMHGLFHKKIFADFTRELPLQAPITHELRTREELLAYGEQSGQWVFKPVWASASARTLVHPDQKELQSLAARGIPSEQRPWIAQHFVSGREYSSYSVLHKGRVCVHCVYETPYRNAAGAPIYFSPALVSEIDDYVRAFGEKTEYTGQVGFDFIQSDSTWYVLGCTPRTTEGIHLFSPKNFISAFLGKEKETLFAEDQPKMFASAMLCHPKKGGTFWKDFFRAKDVVWQLRDPLPSLTRIASRLEFRRMAKKQGISPLEAETYDMEWTGRI